MITVSKEDYLKSILEAETEGETVISARLAQLLKVSPPAVTMALRRLKKDGLVRVGAKGEVSLTGGGRRIARRLTLRHHLIERMLSEMFGMEWWKVHDEAERLEAVTARPTECHAIAFRAHPDGHELVHVGAIDGDKGFDAVAVTALGEEVAHSA